MSYELCEKKMDKEKAGNIRATALLFRAIWAIDKKGDYKKGLKIYEKIIASGHFLVDAYCGIGVCQKMLGDQEAAIAAAQEALQIKDDHYKTLQLLASIYNSQGNDELTYEYVSRALACKPKTMTEISPRLAGLVRKALRGMPDDYIEDTVEFDYLDTTWISWAEEFKKEYETKHPRQMQEQNDIA